MPLYLPEARSKHGSPPLQRRYRSNAVAISEGRDLGENRSPKLDTCTFPLFHLPEACGSTLQWSNLAPFRASPRHRRILVNISEDDNNYNLSAEYPGEITVERVSLTRVRPAARAERTYLA